MFHLVGRRHTPVGLAFARCAWCGPSSSIFWGIPSSLFSLSWIWTDKGLRLAMYRPVGSDLTVRLSPGSDGSVGVVVTVVGPSREAHVRESEHCDIPGIASFSTAASYWAISVAVRAVAALLPFEWWPLAGILAHCCRWCRYMMCCRLLDFHPGDPLLSVGSGRKCHAFLSARLTSVP